MWGSRREKEVIPDFSPPTLPLAKFKEKPIGKRQCNSLLRETRSPLGTDGATESTGAAHVGECQAQLHLKTRLQILKLNVFIDIFIAQTYIMV